MNSYYHYSALHYTIKQIITLISINQSETSTTSMHQYQTITHLHSNIHPPISAQIQSDHRVPLQISSKSLALTPFRIPNISKIPNAVERYVQEFDLSTSSNIQPNNSFNKSLDGGELQKSEKKAHKTLLPIKEMKSKYLLQMDGQFLIKGNSFINIELNQEQTSQQRESSIQNAEIQYIKIKEKLRLPSLKMAGEGRYNRVKDLTKTITIEDIEKQIKKSFIKEGDNRYFADLDLLKKGRRKIIEKLQDYFKPVRKQKKKDNTSYSYQQKLQLNKRQFVTDKILKQREYKKNRMVKGRSSNWNVYYDILALDASSKQKLTNIQKFASIYNAN